MEYNYSENQPDILPEFDTQIPYHPTLPFLANYAREMHAHVTERNV